MNKLKILVSSVVLAGATTAANAADVGQAFTEAATSAKETIFSLLPGIALIGGAAIGVAVAIGGFNMIKSMAKRL